MRKARKTSGPDPDAAPPQTASTTRRPSLRSSPARLALYHALLLGGLFLFWYLMTEPGLIPPFYFDDANQAVPSELQCQLSRVRELRQFAGNPSYW